MDAVKVVVSCEHAGWQVPEELEQLGLGEEALRSHASWDPGALELAEHLAERLQVPLSAGRWSRLVADLNRDPGSHEVVPAVAFGLEVPANGRLTPADRKARVQCFHAPYWDEVHREIEVGVESGRVLHLSIHTFDPSYGEAPRPWDFGVLHDPDAPFEAAIAHQLERALDDGGHHAAANVPYDGRSDFLVTSMRRRFASDRYAGILLEVSQRHLDEIRPAARWLTQATLRILARLEEGLDDDSGARAG